jgi:bacterioferritin
LKNVIECDLRLELEGIEHYRAAIRIAEQHNDFVTRDLFIHILEDEEEHQDQNKTELELIERIGIENFGLSQM